MSSNSVEPRNHKELETIECCHPSADRQCACVWASRVPVTIAPSSGVCLIIALGRCISSIPAVSLLSDAPHKRRLVQLVIYSIAIDRVTIKKYLPAICLCVRVCVSLTDWRGKKIIGDLSIISALVFVSCVCVCQCVAVSSLSGACCQVRKKGKRPNHRSIFPLLFRLFVIWLLRLVGRWGEGGDFPPFCSSGFRSVDVVE